MLLVSLFAIITVGIAWAALASRSTWTVALVGSLMQALQVAEDAAFHEGPADVLGGDGADSPLALGPASGEVTATGAVLWARALGPALLHFEYDTDPTFPNPRAAGSAAATAADDFTVRARLDGLLPNTRYFYRVAVDRPASGDEPARYGYGSFRTAPGASRVPIAFVFSGDLGGAGYCRHADEGYAIFRAMTRLAPDFFVAMGDMIYADGTCPAQGPQGRPNLPGTFRDIDSRFVDWQNLDQVREVYHAHWRYNLSDPHVRAFYAQTSTYAIWDDHEVINNFGGGWTHWDAARAGRLGFPNLVRGGRDAFLAYSPRERDPHDPDRLYRAVSWSPDLELFFLDTRSYRSRNEAPDGPEKTMLGTAQLTWLKEGLARSTASWKVIVSSVTLSVPTGNVVLGRDGWANGSASDDPSQTGFERELLDLIGFLDERGLRNVVFLSADVHRPLSIRYEVDLNRDGRPLRFHEFVVGPLSASRAPDVPRLDPTLSPTLLYGEGDLFNFGYLRIVPLSHCRVPPTDPPSTASAPAEEACRAAAQQGLLDGDDAGSLLVTEVRGADGATRPGSRIVLRGER